MSESQNHRAWGAFPSPLPDLRAPRRRRKRKVRATGSGNGGRSSVHDDTCNSYTRTVLVGSTASIGQRYLPAGRKAERSRPLVTRRRLCYVTVQCSAGPAPRAGCTPAAHTARRSQSQLQCPTASIARTVPPWTRPDCCRTPHTFMPCSSFQRSVGLLFVGRLAAADLCLVCSTPAGQTARC